MRHSVKRLHKSWAKSYMIQGQGHLTFSSHIILSTIFHKQTEFDALLDARSSITR